MEVALSPDLNVSGLFRIAVTPRRDVLAAHAGAAHDHVRNHHDGGTDNPARPALAHKVPHGYIDEVEQRERDNKLPGKVHQLVLAQAGQRAAQPDHDADGKHDLREKPDPRRYELKESERCRPSAKK